MMTTQDAGRLGAQARNKKYSSAQRSEISRRAARTRKERNPNAFSEMGKLGGRSSHKGNKEQ